MNGRGVEMNEVENILKAESEEREKRRSHMTNRFAFLLSAIVILSLAGFMTQCSEDRERYWQTQAEHCQRVLTDLRVRP